MHHESIILSFLEKKKKNGNNTRCVELHNEIEFDILCVFSHL